MIHSRFGFHLVPIGWICAFSKNDGIQVVCNIVEIPGIQALWWWITGTIQRPKWTKRTTRYISAHTSRRAIRAWVVLRFMIPMGVEHAGWSWMGMVAVKMEEGTAVRATSFMVPRNATTNIWNWVTGISQHGGRVLRGTLCAGVLPRNFVYGGGCGWTPWKLQRWCLWKECTFLD